MLTQKANGKNFRFRFLQPTNIGHHTSTSYSGGSSPAVVAWAWAWGGGGGIGGGGMGVCRGGPPAATLGIGGGGMGVVRTGAGFCWGCCC